MTKELTITYPYSNGYEHYLNVKFDNTNIILNDNIIVPNEILNKLFYEYNKYKDEISNQIGTPEISSFCVR